MLDANGKVAALYEALYYEALYYEALYEVRGQPASVFIDAGGTVQTIFYSPINQGFINEQINELLKSWCSITPSNYKAF